MIFPQASIHGSWTVFTLLPLSYEYLPNTIAQPQSLQLLPAELSGMSWLIPASSLYKSALMGH